MIKKHTTLSIDDEVIAKAKSRGFNISDVAERALQEKLNIVEKHIDTSIDNCEFCGREQEKETAKGLKKGILGLTWLFPYDMWICWQCLGDKVERLKIGQHQSA